MSYNRCEEPGTYGLAAQNRRMVDNTEIDYGFMNINNLYL